jgi:ADP-L-glycero-D-manno-heptose 6-epimerase
MNENKNGMIVITGAAGFIGSGIVRHLNDLGMTNLFLVDDIKKTEKWKNLLKKKFTDFISKHDLFDWLQGREHEISAFIHLGACSDTLELDGSYLMENNYRYTLKLAEYALKHGHRFIYASSAATYGDGVLGFSDHHDLLDELQPLNLYGYSKHLFDMWAKQQGVLDRMVGLKYFNVFGPNEHHKGRMSSFVYQKFPSAFDNQPIRLFKSTDPRRFSDGDQCRDFIYVKDAAKMTCDFLTNNHTGIYNIGSGAASTWNHLARSLYKALNKPALIEYMDMPSDLARQYQNYTCADMAKYCNVHGYESSVPNLQYSVEEGVIDYTLNHLLKAERW